MTRAILGIGANLGDPAVAVRAAVEAIDACAGVQVLARSSLYRTAPVGGPDQPDFINAVVEVETSLTPAELLHCAQVIEQSWHRTREVRWGPRTLDIDVITFGGLVSDDPMLTLPHPRAAERGFVLVPWHEIDAEAELPGAGRIEDLLRTVRDAGIERWVAP